VRERALFSFMIVCLLVLSGCATMSVKKMLPEGINTKPRLPSLSVEQDIGNSKLSTDLNLNPVKINDLFSYQYTKSSAPTCGRLVYSAKSKYDLIPSILFVVPLSLISALSLGTLNLLGMPLGYSQAIMEIEASIYTARGERVKTYRSSGNAKAFLALYYGYKGYPTSISPLLAAKKAIDAIYKEQLDDINVLNEKLLEASHADSMAWRKAENENSVTAYRSYLESYKYGNYRGDAAYRYVYLYQTEIDSIHWNSVRNANSLVPVYEFIYNAQNNIIKSRYVELAEDYFQSCLLKNDMSTSVDEESVWAGLPISTSEMIKIPLMSINSMVNDCKTTYNKCLCSEFITTSEHIDKYAGSYMKFNEYLYRLPDDPPQGYNPHNNFWFRLATRSKIEWDYKETILSGEYVDGKFVRDGISYCDMVTQYRYGKDHRFLKLHYRKGESIYFGEYIPSSSYELIKACAISSEADNRYNYLDYHYKPYENLEAYRDSVGYFIPVKDLVVGVIYNRRPKILKFQMILTPINDRNHLWKMTYFLSDLEHSITLIDLFSNNNTEIIVQLRRSKPYSVDNLQVYKKGILVDYYIHDSDGWFSIVSLGRK